MGLRAFVRRHKNVFSVTTEEIDNTPDEVETLEEEYGEQAIGKRRDGQFRAPFLFSLLRRFGLGFGTDESVDGILEIDEATEEAEKPSR